MSIVRTYTNKLLDVANPKLEDIDLEYLVIGVAREGRFANQQQYKRISVAEHSVLVSYLIIEKEAQLLGLAHDLQESITRDLPSPIKSLIPKYKELEDTLLNAILKKFKIKQTIKLWQIVKAADLRAYELEKCIFCRVGTKKERKEAFKVVRNYNWEPGLSVVKARKLFLNRWLELTKTLNKPIKLKGVTAETSTPLQHN